MSEILWTLVALYAFVGLLLAFIGPLRVTQQLPTEHRTPVVANGQLNLRILVFYFLMTIGLCLLWPLAVFDAIQRSLSWRASLGRENAKLGEWLTRKTTVAAAESSHVVVDDRLGPNGVPFGFCNDQWRNLVAKMREGDELWEFRSPPESWRHLAGRAGIALVRRGRVIDHLTSAMN